MESTNTTDGKKGSPRHGDEGSVPLNPTVADGATEMVLPITLDVFKCPTSTSTRDLFNHRLCHHVIQDGSTV